MYNAINIVLYGQFSRATILYEIVFTVGDLNFKIDVL